MRNKVKELEYSVELLEKYGVIPFTLRKDSLNGEEVISWNTNARFFPEDMKSGAVRINYVFGNAKKAGLDELIMPDQPKDGEKCHEITYEEILDSYKTGIAHRDGTIWNVDKKYDAVFMTRETHFLASETFGRSLSLVFPSADCAIVRMYDKKNDVIGLTHSDFNHTSANIIKDMVSFLKEHFNSSPEDIVVMVGAFGQDDMIWDKYPSFAEDAPEVWKDYIEQIDETHFNVNYGDRIYDQLVESGLSKENIYFSEDNTVKNKDYFSNNRAKLQGDRDGRNLFGITFDALPVFESRENNRSKVLIK